MYKKIVIVNNNLEVIKVKNWLNKISREKLQRYLFVGVLALVFVAFFISLSLVKPNENTPPSNNDPEPPVDDPIVEEYEVLKSPVLGDLVIVRKFYNPNSEKEDRLMSLYKIGTRYSTSTGVSWEKEDGEPFEVYASLSGTVKSVRSDNLYGTVVVLTHDNNLETHYISLGEVYVSEGQTVKQGDKIGISTVSSYDNLRNHIHFKVIKKNRLLDPLTVIGKKINTIE